jgi:RNA polymerase sigma-70 factor, ECF subfamily
VTSRSRAADESGRGGGGFADRRRTAGARDGDTESDNDLAARASAGDRSALEILLDRHADRIHAVCRRILGDREDALDATQEAMIAVARGIARFDRRSAFTTWLYRVSTNAALDEGRRKARRPRPVERPAEAVVAASPEDAVGARLDVDAALRHLPEEFRVAVVLRDLCDLDYAEIADVLDVPAGTVRSRIARGRAALVEALGNRGRAPERPTSETRPTGP